MADGLRGESKRRGGTEGLQSEVEKPPSEGHGMKNKTTVSERWALGLLACIAAVTFFFPLVSLHVPTAGDQQVSGYDAVSRMKQFREEVTSKTGENTEGTEAQSPTGQPASESSVQGPSVPVSVRVGWLIPIFLTIAFLCALVTLIGSFFSLSVSKIGSTIGALCGLAAIMHIFIMNSDLHTFLEQSMMASAGDLKGNPFAAFAQRLGDLLVNAFQVKPGVGLYILTASLALAALASQSRVLSRLRLIETSA
jgi:hypothetical protein